MGAPTPSTKRPAAAHFPRVGSRVLFTIAQGEQRPFLVSHVVDYQGVVMVDGWIFGIADDRHQMWVRENPHGQLTPFLGVDGLLRAEGILYGDGVGEWQEDLS